MVWHKNECTKQIAEFFTEHIWLKPAQGTFIYWSGKPKRECSASSIDGRSQPEMNTNLISAQAFIYIIDRYIECICVQFQIDIFVEYVAFRFTGHMLQQPNNSKRLKEFIVVVVFFFFRWVVLPNKKKKNNRITPNWNIFLFGGPLYFCVHYWNCRFHCCGIEITVLFLQPAIVIFPPYGRICSHYA